MDVIPRRNRKHTPAEKFHGVFEKEPEYGDPLESTFDDGPESAFEPETGYPFGNVPEYGEETLIQRIESACQLDDIDTVDDIMDEWSGDANFNKLVDAVFLLACRYNRVDLLVDIWHRVGDKIIARGAREAAANDHYVLVDELLEKGVPIKWAMYGAAEGGNRTRFDMYVRKGARDWDGALKHAAKGNRRALVLDLIKKGAHVNYGLFGAAMGGHDDLVRNMIARGAKPNFGLLGAAAYGHDDIMILMFQHGATNSEGALKAAMRGGQIDTAEWLTSMGIKMTPKTRLQALEGGHLDIYRDTTLF